MVQCCWLWLVWIIWQLVWTSTWQLGWKVTSTLRCRMVLPEVRYWKLVESYGLQTLCECHERCGYTADLGTGENCCPGEDASWYGRRRAYFGWQESFGERTRKTPKEAQWPEENGKAHRGLTKLDQQRIQTPRVRECKAGGVAREPQSAKRNFESGLRGDQDSPGGPAERRGIDGQKQEPLHVSGENGRNSNPRATRTGFLEGIGFEETNWVDTRRLSGGNRRLDVGSSETQQRSGRKEEKTPRGDRERIWERCQNGRRLHGWSGWFSVVVRVQTRILQAISEWKRPVEGKAFGSVVCCDRSGVSESVELERELDCRRTPRIFSCRRFRCSQIGTCRCCKIVSENWME